MCAHICLAPIRGVWAPCLHSLHLALPTLSSNLFRLLFLLFIFFLSHCLVTASALHGPLSYNSSKIISAVVQEQKNECVQGSTIWCLAWGQWERVLGITTGNFTFSDLVQPCFKPVVLNLSDYKVPVVQHIIWYFCCNKKKVRKQAVLS